MEKSPPKIGNAIQILRKKKNFSMDELSRLSGVSKSMLSQIESEKVNPTVATVWKIANGLGVKIQALLDGRNDPIGLFSITHAEDTTILDSPDDSTHFKVLSSLSMSQDLEFYLLSFNEGGKLKSAPHTQGTEEYLTVLEGKIKVTTDHNTAVLKKGDFIIYNADTNHCIENAAKHKAKIHLVVRYQKNKNEGAS